MVRNQTETLKLHALYKEQASSGCLVLCNQFLEREFQAHKDVLTTLSVIDIGHPAILTSSQDRFIRVWTMEGRLLANFNVNHPLPVQWSICINKMDKVKKKIYYAIRIMELTKHKYLFNDKIQKKIAQINNFIQNLYASVQAQRPAQLLPHGKGSKSQAHGLSLSLAQMQSHVPITTMKDEYSPRDLKYNAVTRFFDNELRGTTLKQMEAAKRLRVAQQQWKNEQAESHKFVIDKRKNDEKGWINFLNLNFKDKILTKQVYDLDVQDYLKQFNKRLEVSLLKPNNSEKQKIRGLQETPQHNFKEDASPAFQRNQKGPTAVKNLDLSSPAQGQALAQRNKLGMKMQAQRNKKDFFELASEKQLYNSQLYLNDSLCSSFAPSARNNNSTYTL